MDDITKHQNRQSPNCVDILTSSSSGDSSMDSCNSSCNSTVISPQDTNTEMQELAELKLKLEQYTLELDGAHMEIENLTSENENLKTELSKCRQEIDKLKEVVLTNISESTPNSKASNKKQQKETKRKKARHASDISRTLFNKEESESDGFGNKEDKTTGHIKNKEKYTQTTPQKTTSNALTTNTAQTDDANKDRRAEQTVNDKIRKICIISSDNKNNIIKNAINIYKNDDICHYCYPSCGVEKLVENLGEKLMDFTEDDYCIILIGESDFNRTNNLHSMVQNIRNKINEVLTTNIILCTPTYNYGPNVNLFNKRIEIFNNLLYLDIVNNEHAFFLDSNSNLEYSHKMFNKNSGYINVSGMRTILSDVKAYICEIDEYFRNENEDQFFRNEEI